MGAKPYISCFVFQMLKTLLLLSPCAVVYVVKDFRRNYSLHRPAVPNHKFPVLSSKMLKTVLLLSPCAVVYVVNDFPS